MTSYGLPKLLLSRWYFTAIGVMMTILLCLAAALYVPATYKSNADVLLLPAAKSVGAGGNPYLDLGGMEQAADVLVKALSDGSVDDALKREHITGTYVVIRDPATTGPMLLITTQGKTASVALATMNRLIELAAPTMQRVQASIAVPAQYRITTSVVTVDKNATVVRKGQIRAVVAVGALSLILSLLALAGISRVIDRRQRIKSQHATRVTNHTTAATQTESPDVSPTDRYPIQVSK